MNAASVKYLVKNSTLQLPPASTDGALADAPEVYDSNTLSGGYGDNSHAPFVIWDLGSAQTISQVNAWGEGSIDSNYDLWHSPDGTLGSWVYDGTRAFGTAFTPSAVTARYLCFTHDTNGNSGTRADFNALYETTIWVGGTSSDNIVGGPSSVLPPPAPPNAPTYTGVTAGSVTLNNTPTLSDASPGHYLYWYGSGSGGFNWGLGTTQGINTYFGGGDSSHTPATTDGAWEDEFGNPSLTVTASGDGYAVSGASNSAFDGFYAPDGTFDGQPAWTKNSATDAATSLNIQRALDSGFTSGVVTFAGVTPSANYTDTGLSPDTTYWYRYVEVNDGGSSPGPASSVRTLSEPTIPAPTISGFGMLVSNVPSIKINGIG